MHWGIYKFNRLPFGVKVAPGIFQQAFVVMLADLNFAITYLNDILIKREMYEQCIEHIHEVFKKISDFGFKLSEEKCYLFIKKIKYLGHIINKNVRISDHARSSAIKEMLVPKYVKTLQAFLELANNFGFIKKTDKMKHSFFQAAVVSILLY